MPEQNPKGRFHRTPLRPGLDGCLQVFVSRVEIQSMKPLSLLAVAALLLSSPLAAQVSHLPSPRTTANDDSCDIGNFPAATLLLPFFEVDFSRENPALAHNVLFTILNVTNEPQIGRATIWTDWGYPVFSFDIFLRGYDVQGYSMYDILRAGRIVPTSNQSRPGVRSLDNVTGNPRFAPSAVVNCQAAGGDIPPEQLERLRDVLTTGLWSDCPGGARRVGGTHSNATGYVTIDLVNTCSGNTPLHPLYFSGELLYNNVLSGDAIHIRPVPGAMTRTVAEPLVHIRAIPEGGPAGWFPGTNLPVTFYDRIAPPGNRRMDRRQPLPSLFAVRTLLTSDVTIWRESSAQREQLLSCSMAAGAEMQLVDVVRFDEQSNSTTHSLFCPITCPDLRPPSTAASSRLSVTDHNIFPPRAATADQGGWIYLNLSNPDRPDRPLQAWVTVEMGSATAAVNLPALQLGNGCSPDPGVTALTRTGSPVIGPAP
jgi:hypothetical protein